MWAFVNLWQEDIKSIYYTEGTQDSRASAFFLDSPSMACMEILHLTQGLWALRFFDNNNAQYM